MPLTTSHIFDFIDSHPVFLTERYEIAHGTFSVLRHNLRSMIVNLYESNEPDAMELANALRVLLSECLTVPVPFGEALVTSIDLLGESNAIEGRWGLEIRSAFDRVRVAAEELQHVENPVRGKVRTLIRAFREQGSSFRIYCHRSARIHFESLFASPDDPPLDADAFLHSVRDYREAVPVDALIKVGPLRSRGWGACPDALVTAPRYGKLGQIVWSGCRDEEGFGYDPVMGAPDQPHDPAHSASDRSGTLERRITVSEDVIGEMRSDLPDPNELEIFRHLGKTSDTRRAILVQIDGEHGILYPLHSQVPSLSLLPDAADPIRDRLPGETLTEGMFLIVPSLSDVDLGGLQAEDGYYSRIWKRRLNDQYLQDHRGLVQRLRAAGIELRLVHNAVRHWIRPPSTVIHAPQQRRHFEALIKVLNIDFEASSPTPRAPWWRHAWREIAHARGEAIQSGMQGQEIIDGQLKDILVGMMPEIRAAAQTGETFKIDIPDGKALLGRIRFFRILSIEDGFSVPDNMLKIISELNAVEQWRS